MSIFDLDNYTDAVADAADGLIDVATSVADAGKLIGSVLKGIAPVLSTIPGLGTAFAVAVYAAGALAAADKIDDMLIGSASAAMPPGLPRIAFDGGANLTRDIAEGRNAFTSAINSCREAAATSGPQAAAAFDAGLNVARGGAVDPRAIAAGREFALTSGGQAAAASYDAGVAIAKGEGADLVVIDVTRNYVRDMGGATAAAGFDAGVALGYGKTLQEAGYISLHTFIKGNDAIEKIVNFVERVGEAKNLREGLQTALEDELTQDLLGAISEGGIPSDIADKLTPYTDAISNHLDLINIPSGALAQEWGLDEIFVRAAQALLRDGFPDQALLDKIEGVARRNQELAQKGYSIAMGDPRSAALRETGPEGPWKQGYDIGTAVTYGLQAWGPEQAAVRDSVPNPAFFTGFNVARGIQYGLTDLRRRVQLWKDNYASGVTQATMATNLSALAIASPPNALARVVSKPAAVPAILATMEADATSGSLDAMLALASVEMARRALSRQPWVTYYNSL